MKKKEIYLLILALFLHLDCFGQDELLKSQKDPQTGKYGFILSNGEYSIEPQYEFAYDFKRFTNLAEVRETYKEPSFYAINMRGERVSPIFDDLKYHIQTGFYYGKRDGYYAIYDCEFNEISKRYLSFKEYRYEKSYTSESYHYLGSNFFIAKDLNGEWVFIDHTGNVLGTLPLQLYNNKYEFNIIPLNDIPWQSYVNDQYIISYSVIFVSDAKGKYGVLSYTGDLLVPVKQKTIGKAISALLKKPEILLGYAKELEQYSFNVYIKRDVQMEKNLALAQSKYPSSPIRKGPIEISLERGKGKYLSQLVDNTRTRKTETYKDIKKLGEKNPIYLAYSSKSCMIYDGRGNRCGDKIYETALPIDSNIVLVSFQGKYGFFERTMMKESTETKYDEMFRPKGADYFLGKINNKYYQFSLLGKDISHYGYDRIDATRKNVKVWVSGFDTYLNVLGQEEPTICKVKLVEICKSDKSVKEKKDAMDRLVKEYAYEKEDYGIVYNFMATMLYEAGYINDAKAMFSKAIGYGNEDALKSLTILNKAALKEQEQRAQAQREQEYEEQTDRTDAVLNALQGLANIVSGISGNSVSYGNSYSNSSSSVGSNYDMNTNVDSNSHSYDYWKQQYDRCERNAKNCYESLTNTGYKVQKNGQDTGGGAAGSWGATSFSGMKANLRNAQKEMNNIRMKARKEGYSIPQSSYETINVSY